MANPTTNYGFVLPTSTDLVTDLPADFDVALQGVDTRLKALQPGTTSGDLAYSSATANTNVRLGIGTNGQVLAVASGVPAWTTTADVTPLTTKGDVFTFSTVDARIGVGANNTVLTADSAEATGLKWATPSASYTWSSFTPTYAGLTLGNGTVTAFQITIGSLYTYYINLVFGSTTSVSGHIKIPNPVASAGYSTIAMPISKVVCYDASAAKQYEAYGETGDSGTRNNLLVSTTTGTYLDGTTVNATQPFTWAVSDELRIIAQYRIA